MDREEKAQCSQNASLPVYFIIYYIPITVKDGHRQAFGHGDVSTPSFGSHLQPILTRGADYAHHICYTDANILCSFDIAFVPKLDKDQAIMFTQASTSN